MITQDTHAGFTLPNPLETMAEGGADVDRHQDEGNQKEDENDVVERERILQGDRQAQIRPGDSGDTVVPSGHGDPAEGKAPEGHSQGQRDDQKIDACGMGHQEAEDHADQPL